MKKERKEDLLYQFPRTSTELYEKISTGEGAVNYCVFLTNGHELFVRCYHRYARASDCPIGGRVIERQRYVFAKDGCVRYIFNEWNGGWRIASKFREPRFAGVGYPYGFDNSYAILNGNAYLDSDMKYCPLSEYCQFMMMFMRLYIRHPNIEYLVKAGYGRLIETTDYNCYGELIENVYVNPCVDLKSNNLLKMLHLNRTEFKLLRGQESYYQMYIRWRDELPKCKPDELLMICKTYGNELGTMQEHRKKTGLTPVRLARYLKEQGINSNDYSDYLRQCVKLKYDLRNTAISMPYHFYAMHERLSLLIETEVDKRTHQCFLQHYEERRKYAFRFGGLFLRQPESLTEIAAEGRALNHCVGGYAKRHANGSLTILFIRREEKPDEPFYTMEVIDYKIIQCRGYKNDIGREKPPEILDFEKRYTEYLKELQHERNNKAIPKGA